MSVYYFDSSALAKLYITEPGTSRLLDLIGSGNHWLVAISLVEVDVRSAIRRRQRMKDIDRPAAEEAISRFEWHVDTRLTILPVMGAMIEAAKPLVDRHDLRAYDAIQLSACLLLRDSSPTFVCADHDLLRAAASEGLEILNPTD